MEEDLNEKLVRLTKLQQEVTGMKKAAVKDYSDQLKDIRAEIDDTIESIDDQA